MTPDPPSPAEEESRYRHVRFEGARKAQRTIRGATASRIAAAAGRRRPASSIPRIGIGRPKPPAQLRAEEATLLKRVFQRSGLEVSGYRIEPLLRRLPACLRALRAATVQEACRRIDQRAELHEIALGALLIGTTGFYRDAAVFEFLRAEGLDRLQGWRRGRVAAWSAGCSDGAELYSIGMLLAERGRLPGSDLYGTDCRPAAVELARMARYRPGAVRELPRELQEKYLVRSGDEYTIVPELKAAARWGYGDLLSASGIERPFDLISCRNVAIYLDAQTGVKLWQTLVEALSPGGLLVVGKAERPVAPGLQRLAACVYQKS